MKCSPTFKDCFVSVTARATFNYRVNTGSNVQIDFGASASQKRAKVPQPWTFFTNASYMTACKNALEQSRNQVFY